MMDFSSSLSSSPILHSVPQSQHSSIPLSGIQHTSQDGPTKPTWSPFPSQMNPQLEEASHLATPFSTVATLLLRLLFKARKPHLVFCCATDA